MLLITHLITKINERGQSYRVPTQTSADRIIYEGSYSTAFAISGKDDLILKNRSIMSIDHNIA